jgi:hypothetical protein
VIETVFVEEYRKELEATGYPFSQCRPLTTVTGLAIPIGTIIDASIYYDDPRKIPQLTTIEKRDRLVTFMVGEYRGTLDLRDSSETVELETNDGLFGGILVVNRKRLNTVQSWPSGVHPLKMVPAFCPRCLEFLPPLGIQRFRSDSGELFSGNVAIVFGKGGVLCTKKGGRGETGFDYVEVNFVGDPTWFVRHGLTELPIRAVTCIDTSGNSVTLVPDHSQGIEIVACNTAQGNLFEDALRLGASGSGVHFSLAGL